MTSKNNVHLLYIALKPGEVNGSLAAHDGRLLVIVPNYTEVFVQPPKVTDGITQVFAIEAKHDEVVERMDNGVARVYLWKGDPNSRQNPSDKLMVPISALVPVGPVAAVDPVELAQQAYGNLPPAVGLAGLITFVGDDVLTTLPDVGPERIKAFREWAEKRLREFGAG